MSQHNQDFPADVFTANLSRRAAIQTLMTAASAAVLFGTPHQAFAARASQKTLDALASAEEKLNAVQAELDQLSSEFQALSLEQEKTLKQIDGVQSEIDATQAEIEKKQEELGVKQDALGARVSSSYKKGPLNTLNLLLAAESFDELLSTSRYVDKINDADRVMITEIQAIRAELEQEKADLESQKADLEKLKDEQNARLAEMQAKQNEINKVLSGLSKDVKDLMAKRDAEYLAAVAEEEAQRKAAEEANKRPGGGIVSGGPVTGAAKSLERVLSACRGVPSPGSGLCAMWVSQVFYRAGFSYAGGNANNMYNAWCTSSNRGAIKPGMIVAVSTHPHTSAGRVYGHIGIYVGGGTVMDNVGYIRSISLDEWCSYYGATVSPRWGWLCGWVLG